MNTETQQRIVRLIELARAIRAKENAAAAAGDYLLAIVYNRAHFRAVMLASSIHSRQYGAYRMTAINLNEFYAIRMPWTASDSAWSSIIVSGHRLGGQN